MRALLFCLAGLVTGILAASPEFVLAQVKPAPKAAGSGPEIRYFTAIDGLMDGNADVILKETRQGKTVTGAVLDVCYPADKISERKDRFVANLAASGQTLSGTAQSMVDKQPVTVKLTQKAAGDGFDFRGQIGIGQSVVEVVSTDNSDMSEKEFQDNQVVDDGISVAPNEFIDVSPEAVGVRIKLDDVADFLKSLRGQDVEVALASMAMTCDAMRAGEQTINLTVDPERAAALIAKVKAMPGVVHAGWTAGLFDMDRAIRFAAADWRDGDKVNRDKLTTTVTGVLARTLAAKPAGASWNPVTGKLQLKFKRPSQLYPALELTDTIEVTGLLGPAKPGSTDQLLLWLSVPSTTTSDESTGARLNLSDESSATDEEAEQHDDSGSIEALTRELKGQRWDADKLLWK